MSALHENKMATRSSEAKLQWNEDKFRESLLAVSCFFKVKELYDDQVTILRNFFKGNDVYFSAPTGFGKSLIFQAMPIIADHLFDRPFGTSILITISPLVALIDDWSSELPQDKSRPSCSSNPARNRRAVHATNRKW